MGCADRAALLLLLLVFLLADGLLPVAEFPRHQTPPRPGVEHRPAARPARPIATSGAVPRR